MTTYTVKAPDGKTITLNGPEGASESDVIAQAQALYKPQAAPPTSGNPNLDRYNSIRNSLSAKIADPAKRQRALQQFDTDPRSQQLRKLAGLASASTPQNEVKAVARKSISQRVNDAGSDIGKSATKLQSASAGIARGMFGIPERLAAGLELNLPSWITGNKSNASYDNILQMIRSKDNAAIAANPASGLAGELGGGVVGFGATGKLIKGGASRLATVGVPAVARTAKAVEGLATLHKGQKLANAGKLVVAGAAGGGAQATGTGEDVVKGAVEGAIAAPVVAGGFKAAQVITRPFRDVMRLSSAGQILSRLTTATQEQLEKRAAAYRSATGAEPTVFELLPLADRNKILKTAVVGKDNIVEQTSNAIRNRAANLGPEMSARAREILQPQRDFIQAGITRDIANARGVHPDNLAPEDRAMIANAMESPTDMLHLRDQEAKAIMAPHDATPVAPSLQHILPDANPLTGAEADPEVQHVIKGAAGLIKARKPGEAITAGDVTDIISKLRPMLGNGGNDAMVAERAINHLHDVLDTQAPDAGAAAHQMRDAYAARSRMAEGMREGDATRLRDDVQVGTNRGTARTVRNAYDTAEGATGRSLGQGNKVLGDLSGSPEEALRATVKQSRGSTTRPLAQNIGDLPAGDLAHAARAQDESAQALASASQKAQGGSGDGADGEMLVQALAGLHPASFVTTKANSFRKLVDMTYIPESRARTMVDMIFSQNPKLAQKAINAIGNEPNGAKFLKTLVGTVGTMTVNGNSEDATLPPPEPVQPLPADEPIPDASADAPPADGTAVDPPENGPSPYAGALAEIYQDENPDLIKLVQRVKAQEHGVDANGNFLTSKAGAIGPMQVMPDTAPEAAKLAGLPWDEKAYRSDPNYNELLGIAYLSQMLRKYDGDVTRALAAYNAGPGAADTALSAGGANWLASMPAETQDYVSKISGT